MITMKITLILNLIITLLIFIFCLKNIFYKQKEKKQIFISLVVIGIFYLIIAIFSLLWFFEIFIYTKTDYLIIYTILIFVETIFLLRIFYMITEYKKIYFLILFYLITMVSLFFSNFFYFFLISSFLVILLIFIMFSFWYTHYRNISLLGIIYSVFSLISLLLVLFNIGNLYIYSIISNLIFLYIIYLMVNFFKKFKFFKREHYDFKSESKLFLYFRYFIFIITITNLVFISTIAIHEFGHFVASKYYGCEGTKIIYEDNMPYTETLCKDSENRIIFLLAGILFPIMLGIFLFIIGGIIIRDISVLIIGFNLIASYRDFIELGLTDNVILMLSMFGILLLFLGIILLARSRIEEYGLFNV